MRFYTRQHRFYCGVDLHARSMYVCVLDQEGNVLVSKNIISAPEPFLELIAPYREDVAVAVECMFTWYWLADLCARERLVFVLGHALYMRAIHGGKAKNDRIDAHKIAALLRGGMLPQAYVYPQAMRATRDLMRRRNYLMRQRAELLAHITNTNHQYNLPAFGARPAKPSQRCGIAEHFGEAAVRKSIEADLSLIDHYDRELPRLERYIESSAQGHDPLALAIVRTIHGMGKVLGLSILYEIQDIGRFARVQEFLSYSRLVKPTKASGGKILGHSGKKIGNAHLKWARSARRGRIPARQPTGAGVTPTPDGQARQRQEPGDHRRQTRPRCVFHAQTGRGLRRQALLQPLIQDSVPLERATATF